MSTLEYAISCHCGSSSQVVKGDPEHCKPAPETVNAGINLCHCKYCRHSTGVLCVSYIRIASTPNVTGLKEYVSNPDFSRYFCATCGCHIFWCFKDNGDSAWAVATGVITESKIASGQAAADRNVNEIQYTKHINIASTRDGGLSLCIDSVAGRTLQVYKNFGPEDEDEGDYTKAAPSRIQIPNTSSDALQAFCQCGTVRFHITRPNEESRLPHSGLPDLMIPHKSGVPEIQNQVDEKWWLRPARAEKPTQYMAGTCACKSCRLISGFEIQTWAFVPRSNIIFHLPKHATDTEAATATEEGTELQALDFAALPRGILRTYESSPGVLRESCVNCGATVFWHDKWRPDIIDVSVGLLDAPEGARAETWLDWWKGRVSFSEDAGNGRSGNVAARAIDLINSLESGLAASMEIGS